MTSPVPSHDIGIDCLEGDHWLGVLCSDKSHLDLNGEPAEHRSDPSD